VQTRTINNEGHVDEAAKRLERPITLVLGDVIDHTEEREMLNRKTEAGFSHINKKDSREVIKSFQRIKFFRRMKFRSF
jgi:hypothetical protein